MEATVIPSRIAHELQNDFNDLAVEAHNSRHIGITGQLSGLFVSGQHKDVKAAAEAAQVALRGLEAAENPELAFRECSVCFRGPCFDSSRACLLCTAAQCPTRLLVAMWR
jgi:hypothetical protein